MQYLYDDGFIDDKSMFGRYCPMYAIPPVCRDLQKTILFFGSGGDWCVFRKRNLRLHHVNNLWERDANLLSLQTLHCRLGSGFAHIIQQTPRTTV